MMRKLSMLTLMLALLVAGIVLPSPMHLQAHAADTAPGESSGPANPTDATANPQTQVTGGSAITCDTLPEAAGAALLGKIVPCLVYTIQKSTVQFAADMIAWFSPLMFPFLLLVVILKGVRIVQNEPEVYKQGFLLLVKIAIVSTILADLGNIQAYDGSGGGGKLIPAVYDVMAEAQKVVAGAINTTSLTCDVKTYQGPQTPVIWAMMDCVMGKLYGFTVGSGGKPSMLLMTSVAGVLSGFLFGGAWGVAVFFGMLGVLISIFMLVVRTVVGFLIGYLIVCLMLIISPLLMPLTFLRGTAPYFDSYWRTIVGAFLTPIIITAYTMFALIVYDQMLFAPNSIVARIFDYNMIKDAVQPSRKACDRQVTGDPLDVRFDTTPTAAQKNALLSMPNLQNLSFPTLSGGNDACNVMKLPVFKMDKMDKAVPGKEHDELTQIFMELVNLFILAYLISQGQEMLPNIVTQLVGRSSTIRGTTDVMDNQGKFRAAYNNAMQSAVAKFRTDPANPNGGYKSGGAYLKDLPRDLGNAGRAARESYAEALKNKPTPKK